MSHYPSSSKKVAVLIGLTMLVSGAGIVSADAATMTIPEVLPINTFEGNQNLAQTTLHFHQFNQPGMLTLVTFDLASTFNFAGLTSVDATVSLGDGVPGTVLFHTTNPAQPFNATLPTFPDSFYIGGGTFDVRLSIDTDCGGTCEGGWSGSLGLTYTFDDPPSTGETPLPAALPLFATGVTGLAVMGMRKRRKQKAKEQA